MAVRLSVLLLFIVVLLGGPTLSNSSAFGDTPVSGAVPIIVGIQPTTIIPGSDITITIKLDQIVTADQEVRVQTDTTLFQNWTQYVTVAAGSDTVTFVRKLSLTADGAFTVTASCNGTAKASLPVLLGLGL
jgi:hypothetical protein